MPKGKGTYGSKVGRPPKKLKKYQSGGMINGRSHEEGGELIEVEGNEFVTQNGSVNEETLPVLEYINETGELPPISNAMDRSQTFPDVTEYKEGGPVKSTYSASETWKDVRKKAKESGHSDTYGKPTAKKIALQTTDILGQGHRGQSVGDIVKTIEKSNKRKKKK